MIILGKNKVRHVSLDVATGALCFETIEPGGGKYQLDSWEKGMGLQVAGKQPANDLMADLVLFANGQWNEKEMPDKAVKVFVSSIPSEIQKLVEPISYGQLQVLQLLSRAGAEAVELANDAIILTWIVAFAVLTKRISLARAVELVRGKRIEIAKLIYSKSTKKHLKILSKVKPGQFCQSEIRILYRMLKDDNLQYNLRHLHQILLPKLEVVIDKPELQTIACLQRGLSDPDQPLYTFRVAKTMCETCLRLGTEAGVENINHILNNCKTVEELTVIADNWHNRFNQKLNEQEARISREQEAVEAFEQRIKEEKERLEQVRKEQQAKRNKKLKFPTPPVPGNEHIIPITSYEELQQEGEVMNNCVKSYAKKVRNGRSFIYKVYYPERCTLEIIGRKKCSIGELKNKANHTPYREVFTFVQKWLQKHSK